MRNVKILKWKENGKEVSLLNAINILVSSKDPKYLPKGIDKFKIFGRIGAAFDKAEKKGILELEEADYAFLKEIIEQDIPAQWALNKDIKKAFEEFLNAKEE